MMHPDELQLWKRYAATRDDATRNAIAERYLALVDIIASKIKLSPHVSREEMRSAGYGGLLDGIRTFDLSFGVKPATHFAKRIRGAMLDELRRLDPMGRYFRNRVRAVKAMAERLGREPSVDEFAAEFGVSRESAAAALFFRHARRDPYLDELAGGRDGRPSIRIETAYARRYLLRGLTQTERLVISGYFFDGRTMKQIGADVGLSESRVSQITKHVLERMRATRDYSIEREAV